MKRVTSLAALAAATVSAAVIATTQFTGSSSSLDVRVVSETATTITLGWTPQGNGYAFYRDGVRVSHTINGSRSTVKFGKPDKKPHTYGVAIISIAAPASVTVPAQASGPSLASLAQHVIYTAWAPATALRAPAKWTIAVSADPAFDAAARSVA